jgi:16S rRNA processing protein RimM
MPGGERRKLQVESHWLHKGMVVLKFAGVDSISDAESLQGAEIQVPRESRVALQDGAYISDLTGCALIQDGKVLGTVNDVQFGAGDAPLLVIAGEGGKEILVPFAEEFLVKVDTATKRVEMKLPAGLLEVNAPLGSKERSQTQGADKTGKKKL